MSNIENTEPELMGKDMTPFQQRLASFIYGMTDRDGTEVESIINDVILSLLQTGVTKTDFVDNPGAPDETLQAITSESALDPYEFKHTWTMLVSTLD